MLCFMIQDYFKNIHLYCQHTAEFCILNSNASTEMFFEINVVFPVIPLFHPTS